VFTHLLMDEHIRARVHQKKYQIQQVSDECFHVFKTLYLINYFICCLSLSGIMTYPNGDKFVGVWMGDYPLYGQMTRVNGDVYTGEFYNGVYEGFGTLNFGGGSPHFHYVGKWKDGLRHGEGDEFGPNLDGSVDIDGKGTKYSGTWENDQRHGCFQCESACTSLFKAYYFHGTHEIYDRFTLAKFRQRGGEGVVK
jgi:hypothetical protein